MQKFSVRSGELILLNRTILTKDGATVFFRVHLFFFISFSAYFATQTYLHLLDNLGVLAIHLLFFVLSILSIQKIISDRNIAFCSNIPLNDLRVVRFKTMLFKKVIWFTILSRYPYAEFETHDGTITRFKVHLEKPILSQFKFELIKRDIQVEED